MESFKDYLPPKDYNELLYFTNKMKYNLIDNDKNTDLEKTLIIYGKRKTGKTTLKVLIENYLGIKPKPNLNLPDDINIMNFLEDETIIMNNYKIIFTNDVNQYSKDETNVFIELLHQF
jgi:hypothetical protein